MPMAAFKNLGDLIVHDRDLSKGRCHRPRRRETPCEYTYAALDAMTIAVARASKRGLKRGDRVAILSMNARISRAYSAHARGFVAVPVTTVSRADHPLISRTRVQAGVLRPARRAMPGRSAGGGVRTGAGESFEKFVDPCVFETVTPAPSEPASPYTPARPGRRRASCCRTRAHLGGETRLAPGLDRHRYLIAAPLYHMTRWPLAKLACAAHATMVLRRGSRRTLYRRDSRAITPPGSRLCRR